MIRISPFMLLAALLAFPVHAMERIELFQSDIQVLGDSTVEVIETITVRAEGRSIKRGIYRDFPTEYRDRANNRVHVRFDVIGVRRNGNPEPWFTEDRGNGVRLYIGRKDVLIPHGAHTYEITYRTNRQLGFFERHDELYWNVTGNDWAFPIERAVAYVYVPRTVPAGTIAVDAYTGPAGARGVDHETGVDAEGVAWFRTTRTLAPGEGLTIVAGWPKGHVREPTRRERLDWFLADNGQVLAGAVGVLLLLAYYLVMWTWVGRDPARGVVFTRYEPPEGYSPASVRFVREMGYDDKAFTAALVNLAVKGHVRLVEEGTRFVVHRAESSAPLAAGEKALLDKLLGASRSITIMQSNHAKLAAALAAHKNRLALDYERTYFRKNLGPTLLGFALSLLVLAAALLWSGDVETMMGTAFLTVWLSGWSFGTFGLLSKVIGAWREADGVGGKLAASAVSLFAIPFVVGWFVGAGMLVSIAGGGMLALIVVLIGINFTFYHLMKAPTVLGRRLLDEVEGFLDYLAVAESDEMRLKNPPQKTPELFERFLPYAIALGVEDVWGARFESVLAAARREQGYDGPGWYGGSHRFSPTSLASSVGGGLASSISSSSTAPGSSSGGGGGGSSGGGGGGGGGGGW